MTPQQARSMTSGEWMMLLALAGLWGGSFFFYKILVAEYPPFIVVLGRVGIAAAIFNGLLLIRRQPLTAALPWGGLCIVGLLNNVIPFSLIVWGETRISSGLAAILNATTPLFTVLAAHTLTRTDPLTWSREVGVLLGLSGVVLLGPGQLRAKR